MLPATTMVGMAEKIPEMNLATITMAKEGTDAVITEKIE